MAKFSKMVKAKRDTLYFFMVFLRLTPLIPNWFVNISSPVAGIPLKIFYLGTFVGLMPFNYIHVNTGLTLKNITKFGANMNQTIILVVLSFLMLLPTILTKGKKIDDVEDGEQVKNK